jgi:hypothetical protein
MASAFLVERSGQTVLVRWTELPTSLDFHELRKSLLLARHLAGGPVKFIAVVPESVPPFLAPDTQQAVLLLGSELFSHCVSIDIVVEGPSQHRRQLHRMLHALAESVALPIAMRIHGALDDALRANGTPRPFDPSPLPLARPRR